MAERAVRVFVDSNVILSGLLSDRGAPRVLLDILSLRLPFLICLTGRYNIIEIERNLANKLPGALPVYKGYLPKLGLKYIPIPSAEEVRRFSGPISDKDVPVLVSALNGKADYLVTGDKKDFGRLRQKTIYPLKIVSPSEFVDSIIPGLIKPYWT